MNKAVLYVILLFAGVVAGKIYFAFLWYQIQKMMQKKASIFWAVGGFIIRLLSVGLMFFLLSKQWQLEGILFFLGGFFLSRLQSKKKMVAEK